MPTTYAHYRLGQEVKSLLQGKEKQVVESYPELFNIGLHGPDILFYYKPLKAHPVNRTGYTQHEKAGGVFFEKAKQVILAHPDEEAYLAYAYGFLCHYSLDVKCHGYIDEKIKLSGVSHGEIEMEFDRALLCLDGKDPLHTLPTPHIVPSGQNAEVIAPFFDGVSKEQVYQALKGMRFYCNMLLSPGKCRRSLILKVLRAAGKYESMGGMFMSYESNPLCEDSNEKLTALYDEACELAVRLIGAYGANIAGEKPFDEVFAYNFGSQLVGWEES